MIVMDQRLAAPRHALAGSIVLFIAACASSCAAPPPREPPGPPEPQAEVAVTAPGPRERARLEESLRWVVREAHRVRPGAAPSTYVDDDADLVVKKAVADRTGSP